MISSIDIEDMTDAQDEDRGMPQEVWRYADGTISAEPPERSWEAQPYVRTDIARAKIDTIKETCGYAISQWEDWVRDQFEGTSMFADAMAEIEATRAAVRDSQFADLARPSQAGDERVARLVEAAREAEFDLSEWFECRGELIKAGFNMDGTEGIRDRLRAALAAMDTPKGGGDA